jgi:hypothetical protein
VACLFVQQVAAQVTNPQNPAYPGQQQQQRINLRDTTGRNPGKHLTDEQLLDTLRKRQDKKRDTVIFSAKFVRVTNERLLKDSTQMFPLDTTLFNFENYNPLYQPRSPRISLGNTGLAQRPLLFEPLRTIGFDAGLHTLDPYLLNPQDINYYRTRVPYTQLYLVTGGKKEQIFKILHTQNINPQLNVGFNLNFVGSRGFYSSNNVLGQNVSDVNAAVFTWYESKSKRYNLLGNLIYNNLKAPETGSILNNDSIYVKTSLNVSKADELVRLPNSFYNWKTGGIYLKQTYYIGKIDSVKKGSASSSVLPTQRVAYTLNYDKRKYNYLQDGADNFGVFPDFYYSSKRSRDSLNVAHLQNEFSYSFYLRSKVVKNELKLDLALSQDYYNYTQFVSDTTLDQYGQKISHKDKVQNSSFQDITLKARLGYRFNERMSLEGDLQQIAQGRDAGDFLYDAKLTLGGSNKAGKIILEGYSQSSSPALVTTNWISNHYIFHNKFSNQKVSSVSFNYINIPLKIDLKAEYFLVTDYLYFTAQANGIDAHPVQLGAPINLLKVSVGKSIAWRRWHLDNYFVYQKTDYQSTLRTPEVYNYTSLYYKALLFNVLYSNIGINVRYNTPFVAPSYAVGLGQFYNGPNVTYTSYPIATVFLKATLQHTNFFIMYDYANQGLLSNGFYTVNKYPQMDHLLKFGVSWAFYN